MAGCGVRVLDMMLLGPERCRAEPRHGYHLLGGLPTFGRGPSTLFSHPTPRRPGSSEESTLVGRRAVHPRRLRCRSSSDRKRLVRLEHQALPLAIADVPTPQVLQKA